MSVRVKKGVPSDLMKSKEERGGKPRREAKEYVCVGVVIWSYEIGGRCLPFPKETPRFEDSMRVLHPFPTVSPLGKELAR